MCNLCPEDNAGFDPEFEQTLNILLDTYTYVNDGLPTPDESPVDASGHADSFEFGLPGPSTSPAITTPTLDGSSTDAELYLPGPSSSPNTVGFNEPRLPLVFGADQPAAFSFDFEQEGQNPGPQVPAVPQVTDIPGRRRGNFASRVHPSELFPCCRGLKDESLRRHFMTRRHRRIANLPPLEGERCPLCGFACPRSDSLFRHIESQHPVREHDRIPEEWLDANPGAKRALARLKAGEAPPSKKRKI